MIGKAKKKIEAANYHRGNLPTKLLEAAINVLSQVARWAGVSHGAPAHHFGVMFQRDLINKDDSNYFEALEASANSAEGNHFGSGSIDVKDIGQVDAKFIASWGMVHGIATILLSGNLKGVSDTNDLNNLLDSIIDQPNLLEGLF
ncbi:MAG: hypothetical protein COA99_02755 [Moraxellaceae bacterium]|nr:MAG: hypothetical protein COA99_02755 [Moraxellaceae bacterium]